MPRALTEFGQQINACPGRFAAAVAIHIDDLVLSLLLGGRLLNLNGEDPIRLRRLNRDYSKTPAPTAHLNRSRRLRSGGTWPYGIVGQYG